MMRPAPDQAKDAEQRDTLFLLCVGGLLAMAALVVFFSYDVSWAIRGDNRRSIFPAIAQTFRLWASGRFPAWNPNLWGGYSQVADPTSGVFYPPHLLSFALTPHPHVRAFDICTALHLGLLATGSAALLRRLGVSRPLATLAAVLSVLSPPVLWWTTFHSRFVAICWLPWILFFADALARDDRWRRPLALGSLAWGMLTISGYPQLALFAGIPTGLWIVGRSSPLRLRTRFVRLVALGTLAVLLACVQAVPTAFELPYTWRAQGGATGSLGVIEFTSPRAVFDPSSETLLPFSPFLGLATLLLAAGALVRRAPGAGLLGAIGLSFALLSAGDQTPVHGWILAIPGADLFRNPSKLFVVAALAAVLLAALGGQAMWLWAGTRPGRRALTAGLCVLALVEYVASVPKTSAFLDRSSPTSTPLAGALDQLEPIMPIVQPPDPNRSPPARLAIAQGRWLFGNLPTIFGGIDLFPAFGPPLLNESYRRAGLDRLGARLSQLDQLGIGWVLHGGPCPAKPPKGLAVERTSAANCLYSNPDAPGRYQVLGNGVLVGSEEEMFEQFRDLRRPRTAVVAPSGFIRGFRSKLRPDGRVTVASYEVDRVELETTASVDSLLLVRDSWSPGWQAEVDGEPTKIVRAGGVFFGLRVPEGIHRVQLRYVPPGVNLGLGLAGLWLLAIAILVLTDRTSTRPH